MKNKIVKSLSALMLVCCVFSLNFLSIGASYNEFLSENGIEVTKTKYVTTVKRADVTESTMSESALKSLKRNLEKQTLTEHEKNVEILRTLGYHEETIAGMAPEDIDLMMEDAVSFQIQVVYMKANEDGTTSVISEEDCLSAMEAQQNAIATASGDNDGWGNWTSSDGYLRMTVSSVYIDPSSMNGQKGWYYFHTWYEWLIVPTYRLTDAMSIAAPSCTWDTLNANNAYYSSAYYLAKDVNGNTGTFNEPVKTTQDLTVASEGIYYEWQMPIDGGNTVTYIQFYVRARARITDFSSSKQVGVYIKYVHTYPILTSNPSFEWSSTGDIGVSLNFNLQVASNNYFFNISHEYNP